MIYLGAVNSFSRNNDEYNNDDYGNKNRQWHVMQSEW